MTKNQGSLQNRIFIAVCAAFLLFVLLWAPCHRLAVKLGFAEYREMGNIIENETAHEGFLAPVLNRIEDGKTLLRVHAHKIDDIATLLRVVDEFKLRVSVEHAMDVNRPEIFAELKRRRITVIYGPIESTSGKVELLHKTWRNARLLLESGVDFLLMTDHPVLPSCTLLQQTHNLLRCGLGKQEALETLTRKAATFLGVDDRLGTLEKGKWASFVCWNGDPFDLAHYPLAVYAEGQPVFKE